MCQGDDPRGCLLHARVSLNSAQLDSSFVHSFHFFPLRRPRLSSSFPILVSGPALSDVYKFHRAPTYSSCIKLSPCSFCLFCIEAPQRANITNGSPFPCRPILAQTSVRVRVRRPSVRPRNCPGLQKYLMVRAREGGRMWVRSAKLGPNSASPLLV